MGVAHCVAARAHLRQSPIADRSAENSVQLGLARDRPFEHGSKAGTNAAYSGHHFG